MKQVTEKELLGMTLKKLGMDGFLSSSKVVTVTVSTECEKHTLVSIELIPESPKINIANLGKFMAKHGEYPYAVFWEAIGADTEHSGSRLTAISDSAQYPYVSYDLLFKSCKIEDERWDKLNEEKD